MGDLRSGSVRGEILSLKTLSRYDVTIYEFAKTTRLNEKS